MLTRTILALCTVAAALAPAAAQTWPEKTIRLIVPFPAGGPTDIIARVVAQAVGERLGQTMVVDNRAGAGGVTGTDLIAKGAADGYTIALSSAGALAISPSLQNMPYVPLRDLKPLTLVAKVPELLVVPKSSPARSLPEFLALVRAKPGDLNYASTGPGGMPHLAAELLKASAKLDIVHVPYAGAAPAVNDLLPGRTQMMFADIPVLIAHVQGGSLRALAVGSAKRVATMPDVPTFAEQGLAGVEAENWYGIVIHPRTPAPIVAKMHKAFVEALNDPQVRQTLEAQGAILVGDSPEEFSAYIEAETKKWAEVVRVSGAKLE